MSSTTAPFSPSWQSLSNHRPPEWLQDAKFGLYAHWGLYSVPGFGSEWYGKQMYDTTTNVYAKHREKFGDPAEFGYKDFIPMFTAEHYDPEAWADLYARSGAKYGGFSLAHHDGYALWDSKVNRWNTANMGPKRDLYAPFAAAIKQRGLKLVAPFHIVRCFDWWVPGSGGLSQGEDAQRVAEAEAAGWDIFDPQYADFYWNHHTSDYKDFIERWRLQLREVIDQFGPDLIWFDGGRFQDPAAAPYALDVLSHFLNVADTDGRDGAVLNKFKSDLEFNFPTDFGVWTFESGRSRPEIVAGPWVDDMRIGDKSWGWVEDQTYQTADQIVNSLIDRVSRNGGVLLSLSPKPDGTIPRGQIDALEGVGKWLAVHGEAIFNTRPWKVAGEGYITGLKRGNDSAHLAWRTDEMTGDEIRYTQSKDGTTLYAIALGWPGDRIRLSLLGPIAGLLDKPVRAVTRLGGGPAKFKARNDCLFIDLRGVEPIDGPCAWRIELSG